MKLEEKLVSLRKAKGLSQLQLAEMMNVSRQAISRWETGAAIPSVDNLKYLGKLYDVSLDDLFNDASDEPERKKEIPGKTEDALAPMPDIVDDRKNDTRKMIKWLAVAMGLLALTAVIYLFALVGNEGDFVPINDLQKEAIEAETGTLFDFEW